MKHYLQKKKYNEILAYNSSHPCMVQMIYNIYNFIDYVLNLTKIQIDHSDGIFNSFDVID